MLVPPHFHPLASTELVPDCCDPAPYDRFFDGKEAQRRLRSYRKGGLDEMAARLLDYIESRGAAGRTILEVGGGVGDFQVELLRAGAAKSVNVELSSSYESAARELLEAESLSDKVDRIVGDFVDMSSSVDRADLVVLNRVVCCYPWMEKLLSAAIDKTGWLLVVAVPRDNTISRLFVRLGNTINRMTGTGFEAYVHSIGDMESIAAHAGLQRVFTEAGLVWRGMIFERV